MSSDPRLPDCLWNSPEVDVATVATLLRETAEYHDHYEKTHAQHHWWDWYAPYLHARQKGCTPEDAAIAADHYMEEILRLNDQ